MKVGIGGSSWLNEKREDIKNRSDKYLRVTQTHHLLLGRMS